MSHNKLKLRTYSGVFLGGIESTIIVIERQVGEGDFTMISPISGKQVGGGAGVESLRPLMGVGQQTSIPDELPYSKQNSS